MKSMKGLWLDGLSLKEIVQVGTSNLEDARGLGRKINLQRYLKIFEVMLSLEWCMARVLARRYPLANSINPLDSALPTLQQQCPLVY